MLEKFRNKEIYIAPYNNSSPLIKNYLDKHQLNIKFCGYLDKAKISNKITKKN